MSILRAYADPLRSGNGVFQPRFFVEANGSLAEDLIPFITKFEYEDDEAKFDKLTISVANPGLRFKDDPRFKEGVRFRVRFGYLSDISDVKNAVIAHARPHFGTGMPTIEMVALNLQQDMNKQANPINWGTVSSSSVAKSIAARYRFKTDIEESGDVRRQARLQPAGLTDIQYLMSLAKPLNWDCYIEGETLHFHPRRYDATSSLEFTYFTDGVGTLLKFEPDVNMTSPPAVKKAGTDNKHATTTSDGRGATPRRALDTTNARVAGLIPGRGGPVAHKGESGIVGPSHETDPRVIAKHGEAAATKVDMAAIKASAEMIGTPQIKARTMIRIAGVDQQYCGNWRVSKSKHVIEPKGVYRVQVALKRDAGKANSKEQNKHDDGSKTARGKRVSVSSTEGKITGQFSP